MSTVTPTKPKVYKKQGAPLSEAAQYQAKLKSGVYNNPNRGSIGLASSKASGAKAALLAAKADLSIHGYEHSISPEAATAALAARSHIPKVETLKSPSSATYSLSPAAASKLLSSNAVVVNQSSKVTFEDASSQLSKSAASNAKIPQYEKGSVADESGYSSKAARSSLQHKSSFASDGLVSSPTKSITSINYEKIQSVARQSASEAIHNRTTPVASPSRHGLTSLAGSPYMNSQTSAVGGSIDFSKLTQRASSNASKYMAVNPSLTSQSSKYVLDQSVNASSPTEGASRAMSQNSSLASKAQVGDTSRYSKIDSKVLSLARSNAAKTIADIDKSSSESYVYSNVDYNAQAITIARQRAEERAAGHRAGEYNLGGGLYMPFDEVEAIARKFVAPVLADIDLKTTEQRKLDEEYAQEQARLKEEKSAHEEHLKAKKLEKKTLLNQESASHKAEISKEKDEYNAKKTELERLKEQELATQKNILKEVEEKHSLTMEQLAKEKEVENDKLYQELTAFKTEKEDELKKMNDELTAELQPIVEKLDEQKKLYNELSDEHEALEEIARLAEEKVKAAEEILVKSKAQLLRSEKGLEAAELDLSKAEDDTDKMKAQAEVDRLKAEVERKITESKQSQADTKLATDELEKSNQDTLKNKKEIELKNEAIKSLEQEREFATMRPGLNNEKIAALEAEISELGKRQEAYKKKEERKKYEEAIAVHEATIKELEKEKQALIDRENVIIAELKSSDAHWKEMKEKFEEYNVTDSEGEGEEEEKEQKRSEVSAAASEGGSSEVTKSKPEGFFNKMIQITKSPKIINTGVSNKSLNVQEEASDGSPVKRKRGFSLGAMFKKDSTAGNAATATADAATKSTPPPEVKGSDPQPVIVDGDEAVTNNAKGAISDNDLDSDEEAYNEAKQVVKEKDANELEHSFTNFSQGSEVVRDQKAEIANLFGKPEEAKGKSFFTEDV
ncbi:Eis1 protein [Saccharomycopsis crataegensis]|uniref:Eis1 protein n=1 Tax=Saccharomycopsis crataegensis TaxID=43959 RepID=A0AAV5QH14_9ASCO|nr:Eis1 protein [Saccharomycopsis crataegensis]